MEIIGSEEVADNICGDEMSRASLKERWIQAMSKIPLSLIGYKGYTRADALFVCQSLHNRVPNHLSLERAVGLENETKNLVLVATFEELLAENASVTNLEVVIKPVKAKQQRQRKPKLVNPPNPDDYPTPWCRVLKDGKVIRFEDANGRIIPEILWQK